MDQTYWQNVAVIGAAGKMGKGISLMILQEMMRAVWERNQGKEEKSCHLCLVDANHEAIYSLQTYFRPALTKYAEKNILKLREYCKDNEKLVSNSEIIQSFVNSSLDCIDFATELDDAKNASMIFEAVSEDLDIKTNALTYLKKICSPETIFFTNTSSIPISVISENCDLQNRIIGFHFYNPPTVQKLVELVLPKGVSKQLSEFSYDLAQRLGKKAVLAEDVPGFIGNGHMIREMNFANDKVKELSKQHSLTESILLYNQMTQDYLVRPMGIFQLMDFVGLDVCLQIARFMEWYLHGEFKLDLCEQMIQKGYKGGQHLDGSQKDGFFRYTQHSITGVYDWEMSSYRTLTTNWQEDLMKKLGRLPENYQSWKRLHKDPIKEDKISSYFLQLFKENTYLGTHLAKDFLINSAQISENLVKDGVAKKIEDIDVIQQQGFHHLYPPRFALIY